MLNNTDVEKLIRSMGYISATPKSTPTPSYYKLEDGTILSVLINVNHVLMDTPKSGGGIINHGTDIRVYVPNRYKTNKTTQPDRSPAIVNQDIGCTPLREEFNNYTVDNNVTISVKAVVGQVVKMDAHNNVGEPVYNIDVQPVIKVVDKRQQPPAPDIR